MALITALLTYYFLDVQACHLYSDEWSTEEYLAAITAANIEGNSFMIYNFHIINDPDLTDELGFNIAPGWHEIRSCLNTIDKEKFTCSFRLKND